MTTSNHKTTQKIERPLVESFDTGRFFLVSRRFASRTHEISDLKIALVLSLRSGYTMLRDQTKYTEHERNAKR